MRRRTGRTAAIGSLLAAGVLCLGAIAAQAQCPTPRPAPTGPGLWIPDQSVDAGTTTATISVTLAAGGAQIAGTQSDITFPITAPIAAKANGKPNCAVNPDIDKGATSFAFRPNGCSGTDCTAVRALVLSTENTDAIPDGSVLFTCTVTIDASASGSLDYTLSGVILSDPSGTKVTDAGDQDGAICIAGGATPTATPPPPCPSPRPAPTGPGLWIPDQAVPEGTTTGSISVTLAAGGAEIAGTQSDINFPTNAPIAAKANGKPDCAVNPDIDKGATSFAFRPNGCSGTDCTAVRALVLSTENTDAIPDGSVLFTCNVAIDASASGTLDYTLTGVILSDPSGTKVTDAGDQDGEVCIEVPTVPTPTPTSGETPIVCPSARPAPTGPAVWIPDQTADPEPPTSISAVLAAGGAEIAGLQTDITFPEADVIVAKANGKPDCTVNPEIDKGATSFGFRPAGCGGTSGVACTAVRAIVLSTENTTPIADGATLFTCNINITSTSGTLDYTLSGTVLSDPSGVKVPDAGDQDGTICLTAEASPTPTPTGGIVPCASPRPAPAGPAVWIPDQTADPEPPTTITAVLAAGGAEIAGLQTDITFPEADVILAKTNGKPDCTVNPEIDKGATSFGFRPAGCGGTSGVVCTAVRAIVLSTENTTPIPDGSTLFTCNISITSTTGTIVYALSGTVLSDPSGTKVTDAGDQDGKICITGEAASPTPTPTLSPTEMPPVPTATATATSTLTASPTPPVGGPTNTPSTIEDEGGCQIGTASHSSGGWLLLVPMLGLLVLRRRSR